MKAEHQNFSSSPGAVVLFGSWRHVSVSRHVELSQSRLILPTMCPLLGPKPLLTDTYTARVHYGKRAGRRLILWTNKHEQSRNVGHFILRRTGRGEVNKSHWFWKHSNTCTQSHF